MKPQLSVIIPARNEARNMPLTVKQIVTALDRRGIDFEILAVDDNSHDETAKVLEDLSKEERRLRPLTSDPPHGYGLAVRKGLEHFKGEVLIITMGDLSDSPADLVRYYDIIRQGADAVFGSRFLRGSRLIGYPLHKLVLNRLANQCIRILFATSHNDITNAFKAYRRRVIQGIQPLRARQFDLTVEIPLRTLARGYRCATLPISWTNRVTGASNLRIKEVGSHYLRTLFAVWWEVVSGSRTAGTAERLQEGLKNAGASSVSAERRNARNENTPRSNATLP